MNQPSTGDLPRSAAGPELIVHGTTSAEALVSTFPQTWAVLADWVVSGRSPGVQLFLAADDRTLLDLAVSSDAMPALTPQHTGQILCATKPLIAIALARAAEDQLLHLDDPVSKYLDILSDGRRDRLTIAQLLSHSSGFPTIAIDPYGISYQECVAQAARWPIAGRWWWHRPVYNRTHAWHLLAAVLEEVHREDVRAVIERRVAAPLGRPSLTLGAPSQQWYVDTQHSDRPHVFRPLADPPRDALFGRVNPAYGGFGSAADLGQVYRDLLRSLHSRGELLSAASVTALTERRVEVEMFMGQRPWWGLGFAVDVLRDGLRGSWSPRAFGHSGGLPRVRTIYSLADPERDVVLVARTFAAQARNNYYLARLSQAVCEDLDRGRDLPPDADRA